MLLGGCDLSLISSSGSSRLYAWYSETHVDKVLYSLFPEDLCTTYKFIIIIINIIIIIIVIII